MRRILLPVIALIGTTLLAGCKVSGPLEHNRNPQRVDDPCISIPEQQTRGRDRMSLPDTSPNIAPQNGMGFLDPHGR
jgi:hypothetical protein